MKIQIQGLSDELAYKEFFKGLKDESPFKFDLIRKRVATLQEALMVADAYIKATELCNISKQSDSRRSDKKKSRSSQPAKKEEKKRKQVWVAETSEQPSLKKKREAKMYSPKYEFNKDYYSILMEIKDRVSIEKPDPMKGSAKNRNKNKYCHYHEDISHDTNECYNLKGLLDRLADKGVLKSYVLRSKVTLQTNTGKPPKKKSHSANSSDTEEILIYTIASGFAGGGPTIRGNKDYIRQLDINLVNEGQASKDSFPEVVVTKDVRGKIRRPHDDAIVIECKVANQRVGRILIDTGSSSNLISHKCLTKLRYKPESMHQVSHPLVGFGGGVVHPVGQINLPIRLGEKGKGRYMVFRFLVVDELTAYNMILGRPTLNESKAVIISSLMLLKFERDDGTVGFLRGD
ncbi:uncharacterized protein LOC110695819 [Chenopodium quinoa]|uniref:uncharacterized protein LOC110695819 n=1 Tax=Chenopodium quinoa TaxID=63459 RepID=UPI000B793A90|nr:uncharacterized protein LOC110695819 [Chenopodium quinoa]